MSSERDERIAGVFERERARLVAFVRRRVADAADADDVLQDVFAALVEVGLLPSPNDGRAARCGMGATPAETEGR